MLAAQQKVGKAAPASPSVDDAHAKTYFSGIDADNFHFFQTEVEQLKKHDSELTNALSDMKEGFGLSEQANASLRKSLADLSANVTHLQDTTATAIDALQRNEATVQATFADVVKIIKDADSEDKNWRRLCDSILVIGTIIGVIAAIVGVVIDRMHLNHIKNGHSNVASMREPDLKVGEVKSIVEVSPAVTSKTVVPSS